MKLVRYQYPQTSGSSSLNRLFDFGAPAIRGFERLFDEFFGTEANIDRQPAADLYEDDKTFFVRMELPGVEKNAINLELDNSVLTCSGSYSEKTKNGKTDYSFERSISAPDGVVLDQITADYKDGILTVKLPKKEEVAARNIKVK